MLVTLGVVTSPSGNRPYLALKHRDFRRMAISMLVSLVGTQMQNVAIDWHVWVLTRSPLALGLVGLVRVVPIVILSLVGGLVADRRDRRRVLLVTQSTMTLVALALGAATLFGRDSVGLVYLLTACTSAAGAFDNPSRQSLIPRLVPEKDLPGALATKPASSSPSCGPPMKKIMFTPVIRPRIASGVTSCRTV